MNTPTNQTATPPAWVWHPITTAPRDGSLVYLRSPRYPGPHLMEWSTDAQRWEAQKPAALGWRRICWDEAAEQPTEWAALEP